MKDIPRPNIRRGHTAAKIWKSGGVKRYVLVLSDGCPDCQKIEIENFDLRTLQKIGEKPSPQFSKRNPK